MGFIDLPNSLVNLHLLLRNLHWDLYRDCYKVVPVIFVRILPASLPVSLDYIPVLNSAPHWQCLLAPNCIVFQLSAQNCLNYTDFHCLEGIEPYLPEATALLGLTLTAKYLNLHDQITEIALLVVLMSFPLNHKLLVVCHARLNVNHLFRLSRCLPLPATPTTLRPTHRSIPTATPAEANFILGDMDSTTMAFLAFNLPLRRVAVTCHTDHLLPQLQTLCSGYITLSVPILAYSAVSYTSTVNSSFLFRFFCRLACLWPSLYSSYSSKSSLFCSKGRYYCDCSSLSFSLRSCFFWSVQSWQNSMNLWKLSVRMPFFRLQAWQALNILSS